MLNDNYIQFYDASKTHLVFETRSYGFYLFLKEHYNISNLTEALRVAFPSNDLQYIKEQIDRAGSVYFSSPKKIYGIPNSALAVYPDWAG